ncbi:hypothetical protein [Paraburkholderia caledonica]|uniref:hypothetical protein n=1 Tax=Paraburkholderia caledonica TaxID=134536 RepID=UPI0038BA8B06
MTKRKAGSTTPLRRFWTPAEIETMNRKYPGRATADLAAEFGCSTARVYDGRDDVTLRGVPVNPFGSPLDRAVNCKLSVTEGAEIVRVCNRLLRMSIRDALQNASACPKTSEKKIGTRVNSEHLVGKSHGRFQ